MADQPARLEAATVKAEIGSGILYQFSNDAVGAPVIPTLSGNIPNLNQVILQIQTDGANKISFATKIFATTAAGIAATTNQEIFLVQSSDVDEIYAVWQNVNGTAVDTGKRSLSATAVIAATDAATAAAASAQESADQATVRVARFLDPASNDPVTRDDGQALQVGDIYFNTLIQAGKTYSSNGWVLASVTGTALNDAINTREPIINPGSAGQFYSADKTFKAVTKANVGLSSVDNTSDQDKPVSLAQQTALDLKASIADISIQVSNLTALKAVNVSLIKYVTRMGYSQAGDGGLSFWIYNPSSTATPDDFMVVKPNNGAGRWLLNHDGIISVKLAGARGDGSTDDSQAITKAHTGFLAIYYPPGTYRCASKISLTGQVTMLGAGPKATNLLFDGSTQGFDITQNTSAQVFYVADIAFLTSDTTGSFTALRINGIPQLTSNTDGLRYYLGDRNKGRGTVRNVMFSGTSNASGWGVGLNMECMMNYQIENITYTGKIPDVVGDLTGCAILLNGDGGGTDVRIRGLWVFYALYSLLVPDYMEGIHVNDYEFVVVTFGIVGRYTAGYSKLPAASSGALSIYAHQGHINCLQGGIILEKTNGNFIETQNIYLQPRAADAPAYGVLVNGGNDHRIRDIYVSGDSAANTKANNYSVLLQGVGLSFVDSVTGTGVKAAVSFSGSSYNEVMNLQARACVNVCNGDSGSIQNSVGPGRGMSLTGPKYALALDNNIRMDEFAGFASRTLTAGASANISIPLPAGTFSEAPRFATLSIDQSSIYYKWQYLRGSSSSTQVTFLLAAASPASSIPAETIEVSINAKGI